MLDTRKPLEILLGEPMPKSTSYPFDPENLTRRIGDLRVFLNESGSEWLLIFLFLFA